MPELKKWNLSVIAIKSDLSTVKLLILGFAHLIRGIVADWVGIVIILHYSEGTQLSSTWTKPSRCKNSIRFHWFPHWPVMICGFLVACLTCSTMFIAVKIKYILLCIGAELLLIFYWSIQWPSLSFLMSKCNFYLFVLRWCLTM